MAWIGHTDLRAAQGVTDAGAGPIAQALRARGFDAVALISDHSQRATSSYVEWLKRQQGAPSVDVTEVSLSGPTQFGEIYQCAVLSSTLGS